MEELFINKTKYTREQYNLFLEVHKKEYAFSEMGYTIFNLVFFGGCAGIAFDRKEIWLGIALVIGLVIYLWYKIFKSKKRMEKDLESEKLSGNFINTYKFYKRYLAVENSEGNAQIPYISIYRFVETKDNYYIYISRYNAFIMSKDGFEKGDKKEFTKFIAKKTIGRYKYRNIKSQVK